jgi:hypothetical protein
MRLTDPQLLPVQRVVGSGTSGRDCAADRGEAIVTLDTPRDLTPAPSMEGVSGKCQGLVAVGRAAFERAALARERASPQRSKKLRPLTVILQVRDQGVDELLLA